MIFQCNQTLILESLSQRFLEKRVVQSLLGQVCPLFFNVKRVFFNIFPFIGNESKERRR